MMHICTEIVNIKCVLLAVKLLSHQSFYFAMSNDKLSLSCFSCKEDVVDEEEDSDLNKLVDILKVS